MEVLVFGRFPEDNGAAALSQLNKSHCQLQLYQLNQVHGDEWEIAYTASISLSVLLTADFTGANAVSSYYHC